MKITTSFSKSTLEAMKVDERRKYYVYCLVDPRKNTPFYIGKGVGNRVFAHNTFAVKHNDQGIWKELCFESKRNLKLDMITEILEAGHQVISYIVSYGLTEKEALAAENTLINYLKIIQKTDLTNLIAGHGSSCFTTEELEERFGFQPMDLKDIETDDLILAVKIKDGFSLSLDETLEYSIGVRDDTNLKSRTLGEWTIGRDKLEKIQYIIGVNTGADNAVVSAYKVSKDYSQSKPVAKGRTRYSFEALSKREETLKELGLYKRSLPELKFGSGNPIIYLKNLRLD